MHPIVTIQNPGHRTHSMVKNIIKLIGGDPKDVPGVLALYDFPTMEVQASDRWLGGGKNGGAALALYYTSEFLLKEKKIESLAARLRCDRYTRNMSKPQ